MCNGQVWSGDRVHEFEMKLAGATYMDIHAIGGGINFTVEQTRAASQDELELSLTLRLDRMLKHGTTAIEAKSGYGLETATEMKMLKVGIAYEIELIQGFTRSRKATPNSNICHVLGRAFCSKRVYS